MKWYDKTRLLSFRSFLNLTIGNRGSGKTYGFKKWCIDDFLKTGHQFAWVRRYCTEIEVLKGDRKSKENEDESFFADIESAYPEHKFEIKGTKKKGKFLCDGKVMGHYFALSTSNVAKSSSFPLIDKIIFDEFLIMGKTYKYLSEEVVILLELIETIFRNREEQAKTDPTIVKPKGVYLIGNNITLANPYFLFWNIPNFSERFWRDRARGIAVEKYCDKEFVQMKKASSLGKLTTGTAYADYAIENQSFLDNERFIAKRPTKNCEFQCAIDYKGKTLGFWLDFKNGNMYVNRQFDPYSYNHYSLTKDDHTLNTFLVKNLNNTYIKNIVWLFRAGSMYFEDIQVKALCFEMLSYFVR